MAMTIERAIHTMGLDRLLEDQAFSYDPRQGVIYNPAQTRYCLLSCDLLGGVHRALREEAGDAWTIILKSCGLTWGGRLARRLDRELQSLGGVALGETPIGELSHSLKRYFGYHGWGELSLQFDLAQSRGILQASLRESIFLEVIQNSEEMVDWLMAGILASLFGYLSDQELDCLQVECPSRGAEASHFIISAPSRIQKASERLKAEQPLSQILSEI